MNSSPSPAALLDQKWRAYTAAGAAAAAGMVGSAQAAVTFIDYNDTIIVDPIVGDGVNAGTIANWGLFPVDFNTDGQVDVYVGYRQFDEIDGAANIWPASGAATGVVGLISSGFNYPSRLAAGASIGPSASFIAVNGGLQSGRGDLAWGSGYLSSQWVAPPGGPAATGYLGFRFRIGTDDHYGWVRISVEPAGLPSPRFVTVHDAAYETLPNTGLVAGVPEPASLGLLALGGTGLTAMRRRRQPV
jgi:hypothetical protein